ncbi:MAG: hypothetical protein IPM42_01035 [Saprospiraceae bacterium]|nr:hypothetical protein [Saprospiraceae bacterium]
MTSRISSNLTLFFKLFLPTIWIVFFGTFGIAIFISENSQIPLLTSPAFKYSFLFFYLLFLSILYYTIIPLKRVEFGSEYYVVSNYFKTFRLYYSDMKEIDIISLGRFKYVVITFTGSGSFGKKIKFLASSFLWNNFMSNNPETARIIETKIVS